MKKVWPFVLLIACLGCNFKELPIIKGAIKQMDERRTEDAKRVIRENPKFAELSRICADAVVPEGTSKISTGLASQGVAIYEFYFSDRSREDVYGFVEKRLVDSGWKKTRDEEFMGHEIYDFEKGGYRINLQLGGVGPDANFSIWCEDSKTMHEN